MIDERCFLLDDTINIKHKATDTKVYSGYCDRVMSMCG
jgi:hypothetical protein